MSNTHPKPFGMATTSSDAMSLDEPDFSGLMALTEASIRRKLSELNYPGSDFSSSKDQNSTGLSVDKNHTSQGLQTKDTVSSDINQSKILPEQLESSDSSSAGSKPLTSCKVSEVEHPKHNGHDKQSQVSEEPKKHLQVDPVNNNSMNLLSAFDDPELVKIVSMGLNSKTDSNLKQSVKYCGLSVDLPTENKSPEAKQSPESVKNYGLTMDQNVEKRSSSPKLSFETVRKNANIVTDSSTGKVSPPSRLSPESVKYCGLNMAVSSQDKPLNPVTNNCKIESVVRNIVTQLESEKANTEINIPESVETVAYDIAPSEKSERSTSEVTVSNQISEGKLNKNSEIAEHERLTSETGNASNPDDENSSQDNNVNCFSDSNSVEKSDEYKEYGDNEATDYLIETLEDLGNVTVSEKVDKLECSSKENVNESKESVSDKSETLDSKTDNSETDHITKTNESVWQNEAKSNGSAEIDISADRLKSTDNEKVEESNESVTNKFETHATKVLDSIADHIFEENESVEKKGNKVGTLAEKDSTSVSLELTSNEMQDEHTETVDNKSETLGTESDESNSAHGFKKPENEAQNENELALSTEKDNSSVVVSENELALSTEKDNSSVVASENKDPVIQTGLPVTDTEMKDKDDEQVPDNDLGLVISDTGVPVTDTEMKDKDDEQVPDSDLGLVISDTGLPVTDIEMKDKDDKQVPDNDLGLVISDVCSATEFVKTDEMKESQNQRIDDEPQKEEKNPKPADVVTSKEVNSGQELHEELPTSADVDMAVDSDSDDAVSENETLTVEIESRTVRSSNDKCLNPLFSSLGNDSESSTLDSVDNDIKSLVATVSAELNSEEEKEGHLKSNFETISFSSERINKSDSDIDKQNETQVTNQENLTEGSISPCGNGIAVTEVVPRDLCKARDSLAVEPIVPSPVNTELSALEGMVMRVTQVQKENQESRQQASFNDSDKVRTVSAVNISPSTQVHENQVNTEQKGNETDIDKMANKTAGVGKENDEMQTNELNASEDSVTSKGKIINEDSDSHGLDSNLINANEGKIMPNKDKDSNNSATSMSPVPKPSEDTKSGPLAVTEDSSPTENEDMLMITNVRTISLDELEAEQLSQETERENDILPMTQNVQERNQEKESQNQNGSFATNKNIQSTGVSEPSSTKSTKASVAESFSSISATRASDSEGSKTSLGDIGRIYPSDFVGSVNCSQEPVLNKSLYSIVPSQKQPSSRNFSSPARSATVGETNSSPVSAPAASNTGMPVIANTFTVKEEPIDYEPFGMPEAVASSGYGHTNTQLSNFQSYDIPGTHAGRQLNRQSSEQQFFNVTMVRQDNQNADPKYTRIPISTAKQFVNIGKSAQILSGKVATSNSFMGPSTQGYNNTHATKGGSHNNANNRLQYRKSPVTVIMSQTPKSVAALRGNSLIHKVNISKSSAGAVRAPKVQTVKRVVTGPPIQPAQNHPSVTHAPAKPANVPKPKFAMNLKTINIETVGIPMITEMIARKNPVPVYKPSPPPKSVMGNEKTKQTFPCYECGDTFYFTSSLEQHINRCSMKLSYKCEWCKRILLFTNKCQLLSHLRSHMNIDKNQAVPIHIKSDSIEIQTNFDDIIPGKEFKWFKIPETEKETIPTPQEITAVPSMSKNTPQVIRVCKEQECTECKLTFYKKDDNAKSIHYAPDKNVKPIFCGTCPMYLRNYCGMKAHRRLHKELSTLDFLVCPECGMCFENKIQVIPMFLQHIKMKCFHLSRFSSLKCTKCNRNCSSTDELQHHLTISVEQYYKCNKCPMALKTLKSFKTHFSQTHKDKEAEEDEDSQKATAKIIYRCHVCDTLIDDKEFLFTHIEKHVSEIKEQAQDYFHCLQCGLIFFDKKSLVFHYKQSHKVIAKENYCTLCRSLKHDQVEFTHHILNNHIAPEYKKKAEICEQCGLVCADQNGLRAHECHMKNVAFIVKGDSSASQKDKTTTQKEKIPTQKEKKTPQKEKTKSQRKEVEQKKSPQKQIKSENVGNFRNILPKPSLEIDEIPKKFRKGCPVCAATYWSNFMRVEHLRSHSDSGIFICIHCERMDFEDYRGLVRHERICAHVPNQNDPIPKHLSKTCPSCDFIYGGNSKRTYHIKAHRGAKVFICLHCDAMNFSNYGELRSHEVLCAALSKTAVTSPDKSPSRTKIKLKFSKGKTSGKSSPKKSEQYQLEYKCDECGQLFSRKEKQEEHTRLEHGIHPCHLCGLMYESQTSLKKHLLISHEGKKCIYYCWVCRKRRKFFSDVAHLQKHFTMKHKQKVWDPAKALPALPGFDSHDNKTTQPSKRRAETTPEKPDTPVKKLRIEGDKGFKCAKCDFTSEERKNFQAHIKEHKTVDSVQCIECGLCFMVVPSLKKHLFMVHKVRDFDTYLKEHGIEDLKEPEDDSESDTEDSVEREEIIKTEAHSESSEEELGNPLECKVCYKAFDTEHSMKSHMRVHGMAFIKKTRRSLSSSAKKPKLDSTEQASKTNEKEINNDQNSSEIESTSNDVEMGDTEKES